MEPYNLFSDVLELGGRIEQRKRDSGFLLMGFTKEDSVLVLMERMFTKSGDGLINMLTLKVKTGKALKIRTH